jgi:hypothetical protein
VAANVFYTPEVVAKLMIGALVQDLILPRMVTRELERDFTGGSGTVINVRTPPTVTGGGARTYTQTLRDAGTPIVLDQINEVEMALLIDDANRLVRYQDSGSVEALRNATIGRLYGMDVVTSTELTANTFAIFTREAFAFVMAVPPVPAGCPFGASVSYQGMGLRFIRDYDSAFMQDRAVVSVFAGAETLDAQRAIRVVATPVP